jgi:hypothetical protein
MKARWWTIGLAIVILLDSIVTVKMGSEANPLILWVMKTFDISLSVAMVLRLVWCAPLLYIIDRWEFSKITMLCYLGVYLALVGLQI